MVKQMTKNRSLDAIPKTHTIKKKAAEKIFNIVYPGSDKEFKRIKTREIEKWLEEGSFFGNENPVELAKGWQEYREDPEF
jgi:hypothetical protein